MKTKIHYPNERATIDALWTILNQQTESVKRALAIRLTESLAQERVPLCKNMEEALAFVETLSLKGEKSVPADENGIEALISEKYI